MARDNETPDPRLLCGACNWPVLTVRAARTGVELARIIKAMVPLVRPEHAQKVMAMSQSAADQVEAMIADLPTAEFMEDIETP